MKIETKIGIGALIFALTIFCLVTVPLVAEIIIKPTIIAILPEKTKESKLIRIIDKEAGVVCYMIQNDTADFYSGLQCLPLNQTSLKGEDR
jgi:hypothetical protein